MNALIKYILKSKNIKTYQVRRLVFLKIPKTQKNTSKTPKRQNKKYKEASNENNS